MWLFTRYGFYSIACARKPDGALDPQMVMVRARDGSHLRGLQERFPELAKIEIIPTPSRDYGHRLVVSKAAWASILYELAREQCWSNFKNEAARCQGHCGGSYLEALHEVWERMAKLQRSKPPTAASRPLTGNAGHSAAMDKLIAAVRKIVPEAKETLDKMKQRVASWEQPDFIWEALLLSMATMGNSRGVTLTREKDLHDRVRWHALVELETTARRRMLGRTLRDAGVRMANIKARWLDENFARIAAEGGPEAVKRVLERQPGREGKIAYLRTFRGIGPKYARNIMMDICHPDFWESIAIDQRINKISAELGVKFSTYQDAEKFYLTVAHAAGLSGWELDRLLYNFSDEVIDVLPALPIMA